MSLDALKALLDRLYAEDAVHVRRGFRINDTTPTVTSLHLMEETVELVEACLVSQNREQILDEAGDVLVDVMHLLRQHDIDVEQVITQSVGKQERYWTTDPAKVTTDKTSFGRQYRGEPPP